MIRSNYQKVESVFLYEAVVFIWVIFTLFTRFLPDWIAVGHTIFLSYIIAKYFLRDSQRLIIPPLTSILLLYCVFQIDQMIMNTPYVRILTEFTCQNLVLLLKYGNSIPLLLLMGSFYVYQSIGKERLQNITKSLPLVTFLLLFFGIIIFNGITYDKVTLIDVTTLQFESLTRISIVDSCSGIYGLLIFLSSFLVFVNVTRINRIFKRKHVIIFGSLGIIGVYLVNLLRILILVNISLNFPSVVMDEAHIYLGGIFIISFLVVFWAVIWSILPVRSST